ncbi:uncharacterized protein [Pyrus communis]|uniref:uncharacterized protein isoform X3 n=1 Tax=Pyrus communis TaxID=23211 RepID=UPI0035BFEA3D
MDSYQAQQRYLRPPPPPQPRVTSDPYHYHQQQQQPRPDWYPNQYQYPPAPPPPPPPYAEHLPPLGSYPPPPHPYPAQPPNHAHFPPPPPPPPPHQSRPHLPPPPPRPPPPHSYQHAQEWGAAPPSWPNYAAPNNQDWEAKAKAWADARTAVETQHQQLQFPPAGGLEEQSHYQEQYPHNGDPHYSGSHHQSFSASSYQQVPVSGAPTHYPPGIHSQETSSIGSELSPYLHHAVRDGTPAGDSNALFHRQGILSTSPSVHQQEVPYSYSSVTGNEGTAAQEGQHHMQPSQPFPFAYGSQSADPTTNLADQPLEFARGFTSDHGPHVQSSYTYHDSHGTIRGVDPATTVPSVNTWPSSVAPGHDPSNAIPSPVPGHSPHSFGSFPSAAMPFALTAGTTVHPTAAFPGDAYGVSTVTERPKKAPVPSWLRDEIKKAVITSSSMDHPKEETQSFEDEGFDRSFGKGDQADSKSIDFSRPTEEEDDEDQVEAARTAAINQEIKRILTEVFLKVTDELFDEIATKVLTEDDLTVEVEQRTLISNHKVLPSPPAVTTPKASAKVLIAAKSKEYESGDVKSSSTLPGDVLGLANYATDDEDGDSDIQSSGVPNSGKDAKLQQSTVRRPSNDRHDATANDRSSVELQEHSKNQTILESGRGKTSSLESNNRNKNDDSNGDRILPDGTTASRLKDTVGIFKPELPKETVNVKNASKDDPQVMESTMKPDKHDRDENKKSSVKDINKEIESGKFRTDEKGDENHKGHYPRKERTDDRNGSKEKVKEQSVKESESRKRSSLADAKEDRRETEQLHRASAKEDKDRKRGRTKEKEGDRSRHKHSTDSSRHKGRRSSSVASRGRNSKDDSSDEASDDSKRKRHSRRRNLSPSPIKSRRRQVSRSPHSKHSQHRHSPYSSLETSRYVAMKSLLCIVFQTYTAINKQLLR